MEKTFILSLAEQDIAIMSVALGKLPYEMVNGLIPKIQGQLNEQLLPPAEPKKE